jgi:hypothetical protein
VKGGPKVQLQVDVCIGNTNGPYGVLYVQRQVRRWRGGQGGKARRDTEGINLGGVEVIDMGC